MTDDVQTKPHKRGWAYHLLMLLTALLPAVGAGMAVRAVTLPPELAAQVSLSLPLEFVGGALWAGAFALATWRLLRKKRGAVDLALILILTFATYSVLRLLLLAQADYDRGRLPFLLVTLALMLVAAVLVRAAARWRRKNELKRQN